MSLRKLADANVNSILISLVKNESTTLSQIIEHLAEVDRRRLYLKMAYSSLFEYCTKYLGYANGPAQRRIDAVRLLRAVPELTEKIGNGEVNLSQVSVVQKAIRQKKKETKASVKADDQKELFENILEKSVQETEVLVSKALDLEIKESVKIQHQKDESVRLEITLSKEQFQKLERMRELLSTTLPDGSWDQVLEYVADRVIEQKTKPAHPRSNQITPAVKRAVFNRDQCCQHVDKTTGRKCTSRWNLQVDHIQPRWADGSNVLKNLRILCANHNRHRYQMQTGVSETS